MAVCPCLFWALTGQPLRRPHLTMRLRLFCAATMRIVLPNWSRTSGSTSPALSMRSTSSCRPLRTRLNTRWSFPGTGGGACSRLGIGCCAPPCPWPNARMPAACGETPADPPPAAGTHPRGSTDGLAAGPGGAAAGEGDMSAMKSAASCARSCCESRSKISSSASRRSPSSCAMRAWALSRSSWRSAMSASRSAVVERAVSCRARSLSSSSATCSLSPLMRAWRSAMAADTLDCHTSASARELAWSSLSWRSRLSFWAFSRAVSCFHWSLSPSACARRLSSSPCLPWSSLRADSREPSSRRMLSCIARSWASTSSRRARSRPSRTSRSVRSALPLLCSSRTSRSSASRSDLSLAVSCCSSSRSRAIRSWSASSSASLCRRSATTPSYSPLSRRVLSCMARRSASIASCCRRPCAAPSRALSCSSRSCFSSAPLEAASSRASLSHAALARLAPSCASASAPSSPSLAAAYSREEL
mmetsp:Transcript_45708/g.145608  ORF Transcript_45708/g.145608 Transcript_45708/m.145608 type:complete len:474 (+) Transcript_45708:473-1894(+)